MSLGQPQSVTARYCWALSRGGGKKRKKNKDLSTASEAIQGACPNTK